MSKYSYALIIILITTLSPSLFASDATEQEILSELVMTYYKDLDLEILQQAMQNISTDQLSALTGKSEYGTFQNGKEEQEGREWSPSEWASALSGGNNSRYNQLLDDYKKAHPSLSSDEANLGMSASYATDYQQQVATNQASATHATYSFNDTNNHLKIIDNLSEEINKTEDTKRIQDLNARINAEVAYLQVEIVKGLAVMNEQLAQQQATEINDRNAAANFNKIPD